MFNQMYNYAEPIIPSCSKVPSIPKQAAEDTTLTVGTADGGKTTFPVPAGTEVNLHVPGLHYNRALSGLASHGPDLTKLTARYWKDPHVFKPERFLGDWPRDAFTPFSLGRSRLILMI